jgi:hypothetical protein
MFFEILFFALVLIKFDQNLENHVKEIAKATPVRDFQNCTCQLYKSTA